MDKNKTTQSQKDKSDLVNTPDSNVANAHTQAEKDIETDPDMQADNTEDLDEGELARLEGEK